MNPDLQSWLDTATHALASAPAQRVQDEYLAAFQDAQIAGEADILAGWGDPRRVNRELRRVHLTVTDARWLAWISSSSSDDAQQYRWLMRALLWGAPLFIGILTYTTHMAFITSVSWMQATLGSAVFYIVFLASVMLAQRLEARSSSREEAVVSGLFVAMVPVLAYLVTLRFLPWPAPFQMQGLLLAVILVCMLITLWSGLLWRKVRWARVAA